MDGIKLIETEAKYDIVGYNQYGDILFTTYCYDGKEQALKIVKEQLESGEYPYIGIFERKIYIAKMEE